MKVLFVTQTAATDGGIERWLSSLCTGLVSQGVDVSLALVDGPVFHDADAYLRAFPELLALPHSIVRSESGTARGRLRALETAIRDMRPDVVVPVLVHETLQAVQRRKEAGDAIRLVYPIHENEVWAFSAVAQAASMIDAVVSVNALMLRALHEWSDWPAERSFHIRGGVERATTSVARRATNDRVVIGYCGKLVAHQKRAGDLVAFCQELDSLACNYELRIAGAGPLRAALESDLAKQIREGRVTFLGSLDRQALYDSYYPSLDALVIASDWETGPLVAWEAMMHGVAIVTSAYRGLRSEGLLRHGDTALVFPVGQPRLAAQLIATSNNEQRELQAIGQRAQAVAVRELSHPTMIEQWCAALRRVMDTAAVPAQVQPSASNATEWLQDTFRTTLARPLAHSNAHEEWPRYQPGWVPLAESDAFSQQLDALEASLDSIVLSSNAEGIAQHA